MDTSVRIVLMILFSMFALIGAFGGFWCLKKGHEYDANQDESYTFASFCCFLATLAILVGIGKIAGVDLHMLGIK